MCRTSFLVTLEYLKNKNPDKNELIICSYNLEEMVDIARLCDFKIKMIDINSETGVMDIEKIKSNLSNKTSAILFTNMFNDFSNLSELAKLTKKNEILLIEDNAIYLGNYSDMDFTKKYAGSFGDVSLFSFGIMKNVSAFYGGALLTSNYEIYSFANKKKIFSITFRLNYI